MSGYNDTYNTTGTGTGTGGIAEKIPGTRAHAATHPTQGTGVGGVAQATKETVPGTQAHRATHDPVTGDYVAQSGGLGSDYAGAGTLGTGTGTGTGTYSGTGTGTHTGTHTHTTGTHTTGTGTGVLGSSAEGTAYGEKSTGQKIMEHIPGTQAHKIHKEEKKLEKQGGVF